MKAKISGGDITGAVGEYVRLGMKWHSYRV